MPVCVCVCVHVQNFIDDCYNICMCVPKYLFSPESKNVFILADDMEEMRRNKIITQSRLKSYCDVISSFSRASNLMYALSKD